MPRPRVPRPFAATLTVMLAVSCVNPAGSCACDPVPLGAVMYGRVTDPAGNAVSGATVQAQVGPTGCQPFANEAGEAATDADGRFRARIQHPGGPVECLRAFALPPVRSGLRGSDTVAFQVRFTTQHTLDSARVDLVLRTP
ncbi:MAG TPA: carboxypeptidase-like regulatory domain-containing protein [Longimicrobium sp.]|nr:carboxypeptidase-like regulatory domain-containing protein [Longimicrobium sp.]